jgi:hypothetical protein
MRFKRLAYEALSYSASWRKRNGPFSRTRTGEEFTRIDSFQVASKYAFLLRSCHVVLTNLLYSHCTVYTVYSIRTAVNGRHGRKRCLELDFVTFLGFISKPLAWIGFLMIQR